jgi:branched-chain amino acid transport system substrate-binding protein
MQRNLARIFAVVMGVSLSLTILAACGAGTTTGSGTPTAGSTVIKIAADLPVSGKEAGGGKSAEDGAHLAVNEANATHLIPGYTLVFDPKDDVGPAGIHDPAVGAQNVAALVGDALVAGIVGPLNSNVAKTELPITNQAPLAQISPANTNPCLTKNTPASGCSGAQDLLPTLRPTGRLTYFRVATTDDHQGPAGADYLYKTLGYRKVYVIDDAEVYGIGIATTFAAEWKDLGGTVLGHRSEPATTTSYISLLTQVAALHPDVIYFGGQSSTGGTLIRQQMEQVPALAKTPFGGGDGILTPNFVQTIGLKGGPIYGTVAVVDSTVVPAAAAFRQKYMAAFSDPLTVYSAASYDCAHILIQAIKSALANGAKTPKDSSDLAGAKRFRQAVINAIQNTSYEGVTGHQSFDANGDTTNKVISIYQLALVSNKPRWKYLTAVTIL